MHGAKKPEQAKVLCASAADLDWLVHKVDMDQPGPTAERSTYALRCSRMSRRSPTGRESSTRQVYKLPTNAKTVVGCEYKNGRKGETL